MSFNPANFPWTMPTIRVERDRGTTYGNQGDEADAFIPQMIKNLEQAAARFAVRRDGFAQGKADTCLDIAAKLQRFGSFASPKQAEFAAKLVEWSKPRETRPEDQVPQAERPQAPVALALPKLFALMQRLAKLEIGALKLQRKNGDSLIWVKLVDWDGVIGKIENGVLVPFPSRLRQQGFEVSDLVKNLLEIEADPEAAAVLHGKASGRCAVCSRDLTDPGSIARGIGPICSSKF